MLIAVAVIGSASVAHAAPSFERDVRPILKAHCLQCHGEEAEHEGGLDLRLRRLMVQGGDSGAAIAPGSPEKSYLLQRVAAGEMPPGDDEKKKLTAEQAAVIRDWIAAGAPTLRAEPESLSDGLLVTEEDRQFWSFQPIRRPSIPQVEHADRTFTPVDRFLLAPLEAAGHTFAPEADRPTLIRRAYFDLVGLPPSPEEVERFVSDDAPDAYERLIDRLLDSPHYGERWGRHWLDVAGYADSEGFTGDNVRPAAYRYRDYVIRSFNADKPFDRFIREQLAGDELAGPVSGTPTPEQAELLIATGFLQMAPDGTASAEDRMAAHDQLVADTIKVVSTSLLGLSIGCARCHDHRYDPISQDDYYRFRAIFEPALLPANWQGRTRLIPYFTQEDRENAQRLIDGQQQAVVLGVVEEQLAKLPEAQRPEARAALDTPPDQRSPQQQQLLIDAKLNVTLDNLGDFDRGAAQELQRMRQRSAVRLQGFIQAVKEAGGNVPKTFLFHRGNPREPKYELPPGELTVLQSDGETSLPLNDPALPGTGRRLAYARHLTDGAHPLVARVIVNRVWMHHFGRGLCATPADFGAQGERPSHPELLDWLAKEFMDNGWSLKQLHKRIMTSTAFRQGNQRSPDLAQHDPHNRLLGGFPVRRLEAEIVRDAILGVSGRLNRKAFGVAVPVTLDPAGEIVIGEDSENAGIARAAMPMFGEEWRRSVYVQSRRTMPLSFMQVFDAPDMEPNCEARTTSTVAPQSLVLLNSPFVLQQSLAFAHRLRQEAGGDAQQQVGRAWKLAYSRTPTAEELADAVAFLEAQAEYFREHPPALPKASVVPGSRSMGMRPAAPELLLEAATQAEPDLLALALLCQMLISSNEFLYSG